MVEKRSIWSENCKNGNNVCIIMTEGKKKRFNIES